MIKSYFGKIFSLPKTSYNSNRESGIKAELVVQIFARGGPFPPHRGDDTWGGQVSDERQGGIDV